MKLFSVRMKVFFFNFVGNKTPKSLKKQFTLLVSILFGLLNVTAQDPAGEGDSDDEDIILEYVQQNEKPNRQRAPLYLDIKVTFHRCDSQLEIISGNDLEGEVYLIKDTSVVGYSPVINTVFNLPDRSGIYMIEIIGESWRAYGYVVP